MARINPITNPSDVLIVAMTDRGVLGFGNDTGILHLDGELR